MRWNLTEADADPAPVPGGAVSGLIAPRWHVKHVTFAAPAGAKFRRGIPLTCIKEYRYRIARIA